jgi:hypothetical protein
MVYDGRPKSYPREYPFRYCIRHDGNDFDKPITIEPYVLCNFWGYIASKYPMMRLNSGCSRIRPKERDAIYEAREEGVWKKRDV